MKSNLLSVAQNFLLLALGVSTEPIAAQGLMTPGHLFIKKEITGVGGITNLIDSSTKEVVGTSTFNQQSLPPGTKMAIERIRLGLAVVDKADKVSAAGQYYSNKASSTEAKFRAANFIIYRTGKEILRVPVSRFLTMDNVEGMTGEHDCFDVDELRLLQGDEKLSLQLEFPDDVDWTADKKVFVSVELFGPRMQF